jgi:hypothetical protein
VSGEFHAPAALHTGQKSPSWIGDWVDPRAGLGDMEKVKFLTLPELKISHYNDYATTAHHENIFGKI